MAFKALPVSSVLSPYLLLTEPPANVFFLFFFFFFFLVGLCLYSGFHIFKLFCFTALQPLLHFICCGHFWRCSLEN
jgi:hypothetical protein